MQSRSFERMAVIPEQEYNYLRSLQQVNDPAQQQISTLMDNYSRQSNISDPQIRVQRQNETLNELKILKDEMRQRIIQTTPKPYQTRAQSILKFIEGHVQVNDRGELMDGGHQVVSGSNITDLIQHAVRDRRRKMSPAGWKEFKDLLQSVNVPKSLLNYETLDEMKNPLSIKASPITSNISSPTRSKSPASSSKDGEAKHMATSARKSRPRKKARREVSRGESIGRKRKVKPTDFYMKKDFYYF